MVDWFQSVPPSVLESHYKAEAEAVSRDLTHFGRTDALVLCAKLNLLTSDGASREPTIGQVAAITLLQKDGILSNAWYEKLRTHLLELAEKKEQGYAVNRPALLEYMRWIAACCSDSRTSDFKQNHVAKAFVRSLLACSEFYGNRELQPTLHEEGDLKERRFQFLPGVRRAAMWAGGYLDPTVALGRTQLILIDHFFAKNPEYLQIFEKQFGITIEEYMTCAAAIVLLGFINDTNKEKLTTLQGCFEMDANRVFSNVPAMQPKWTTYLDKLAQTAETLGTGFGGSQLVDPSKNFDFRPLRNRPILAFGDKIIIMDQRLFVESYSAGPLFVLSGAVKSEDHLKHYGVACQNYAFQLLERTNKRYPEKKQALALVNEPPGNQRPLNDIALESAGGVVLIEAKGVWLNDDVLYQTDPEDFWNKILEKYGVSIDPKTGAEKRKGTAQLADVIRGLASGQLAGIGPAEFINKSKMFVPVLVMQDYLMTTGSLISHHLAIEFNKLMDQGDELPKAGSFRFGEFTVHSLVPLTLHDLEVLESLVPKTAIFELFCEYSQEVPERGDSFTSFLLNRKLTPEWLPNDQLLVKVTAANVLKRIQSKCFGKQTT